MWSSKKTSSRRNKLRKDISTEKLTRLSSFINTDNYYMNGFQGAGFLNVVGGTVDGVQLAGFGNTSGGVTRGAQLSGFFRIFCENQGVVHAHIKFFHNSVLQGNRSKSLRFHVHVVMVEVDF